MSTAKNFTYYLLPSLASTALGIVMVPISTFFLDVRDFGVAALLMAFALPFGVFSSIGATWVFGAHFYTLQGEERKKMFSSVMLFDALSKTAWFVVALVLGPLILPWFISDYAPEYTMFFRMSAAAVLLGAWNGSMSHGLILHKAARNHAIVEIAGPFVSAIALILCLMVWQLGTAALFISQLVGEIITALLALWFLRSQLEFHIYKAWVLETVKIGFVSIPQDIVGLLANIADRFFIPWRLNVEALGIYAHSLNYRGLFNAGFKAFNRTYVPHILEHFSTPASSFHPQAMLRPWFGITAIAGLFATFFSYEIIDVLTHGKFVEAARLVPLWFLPVVSFSFGTTYTQFLFARKKNLFITTIGVVFGFVSIGLLAAGVYYGGMTGAVIAAVFSSFALQCAFRIYATKLGCPRFGEKEAAMTGIFLVGSYLLTMQFQPALFLKILLFVGVSAFIVGLSGLGSIIRNTIRQ